MLPAPKEFDFVGDAETLREVVAAVKAADLIALDTEFVRERTFYPELCVLQIASDDFVVAIDCLADIDLDPLFQALIGDGRCWLLHSARQDLEVLLPRTGQAPRQMIDTQIASALIGSSLQIGLQGLLAEILDVAIGKEHTRTDWSRRPLPAEAIGYALDDVRYLLPVWRELENRLVRQGRLDWLTEDCARQLQIPIQPEAASILERTRGAGSLTGSKRAAALALVAWREARAQQRNKPRRWILADDALVRIAVRTPATIDELNSVRDLPQRLVARNGAEILAALEAAGPPLAADAALTADKAIVKALKAEVSVQAEALGIQPELLATRREISMAAAGRTPESLRTGWRSTFLADAIARLVQS